MSDTGSNKSNSVEESADKPKKVMKIGSQREGHGSKPKKADERPKIDGASADSWDPPPTTKASSPPAAATPPAPATSAVADEAVAQAPFAEPAVAETPDGEAGDAESPKSFPPPRIQRLSPELQDEIDAALAGVSLDSLMEQGAGGDSNSKAPEMEKRYRATVVKVFREDVFFTLAGQYEGVASLRQFEENPEPGTQIEVIVKRLNREDGLYELAVPGASMAVQDWSDITDGMVVEAKVTGHNTGGLECDVNGIRAFMPVSQIDIYRVEDLEQFVGEKFNVVVTEANESRGNLVVSRRAVMEREKEAKREETMGSLAVGQTHEGIVRNIRDFGAFVDIGGVDGLIHVSKMSWDRVKHPSEVVEEGQKVKVVIEKIDEETGKIGLSYRDAVGEHPWQAASRDFTENSVVDGVVSKVMDFGAFVRLAAGIEGLVHISELAHHRVTRVNTVVDEGQAVSVKILSIDAEAQRMSLSIKQAQAAPVSAASSKKDDDVDEPPRPSAVKKKHQGALKGGTNKKTGGEQFGLNW